MARRHGFSKEKNQKNFPFQNKILTFVNFVNPKELFNFKKNMTKKGTFQVKDTIIKTLQQNGIDYICITDIARQKNPVEPKDVVKNWMRVKNTLEYLGLWEKLNNPHFKGVEFDPF